MISGAFAQELERNRRRYNARFAQAKQFKPRLDPTIFSEHLETVVAPIITAVESMKTSRINHVIEACFDISLELVSRDILGGNTHAPEVVEGWKKLLPAIPELVNQSPYDVLTAVSNALYNISSFSSARPNEWLNRMIAVARQNPDLTTFFKAGQVAAWCSGLAHYREQALLLCQKLPPTVAQSALDIPRQIATDEFEALLNMMQTNPWHDPYFNTIDDKPNQNGRIKIVAHIGAFRGFGGIFLTPPRIISVNDSAFILQEEDQAWMLFADCFGATFHRIALPQQDKGTSDAAPINWVVEKNGRVSNKLYTKEFPELSTTTSYAQFGPTLAITTRYSHGVFLLTDLPTMLGDREPPLRITG